MKVGTDLFIGKDRKVGLDVNETGAIYMTVFKKVAEKQVDEGRVLPIFFNRDAGEGQEQDKKVAKLNSHELSAMIGALDAFIKGGADGFKAYSKAVLSSKTGHLLFYHDAKTKSQVGLKVRPANGDWPAAVSFALNDADNKDIQYEAQVPVGFVQDVLDKMKYLQGKAFEMGMSNNGRGASYGQDKGEAQGYEAGGMSM
jgi:hypothetical protein